MSWRREPCVFSSLSRQAMVGGINASPTGVLKQLLSNVVQRLGDDLVGHAKAIAHVDGGLFHASTTGASVAVDVTAVGSPDTEVNTFRLEFMCTFHGLREKTLINAWNESIVVLAASGVTLTPAAAMQRSHSQTLARPRPANLSIVGSLASSFFVLKPCCLIPVLWSISGGSVGVLQVFEPLEPYRLYFIAVTVALLSLAFFQMYFQTPDTHLESVRKSVRRSRRVLWFATAVFLIATVYPLVAPPSQHAMHHGATHVHD